MTTKTIARPATPAVPQQNLRGELVALLPDLRAFARFLVRDRAGADDLVQETLVRALPALARLTPDSSLKAWLFTIQRNAFYEQARRRKTEQAAIERSEAGNQSVGAAQETHADIADLQRVLWTLPPSLREALVLVGAQGMTAEEAAKVCQIPVNTMKARVTRGRVALAAAMPT